MNGSVRLGVTCWLSCCVCSCAHGPSAPARCRPAPDKKASPWAEDPVESLEQGPSQTRTEAMKILAHEGMAARSAVPKLLAILKNESEPDADRCLAALALGSIGSEDLEVLAALVQYGLRIPVLGGPPSASVALSRIGRPAVPVLILGLHHLDPEIRYWAAFSLGKIGPPAEHAVAELATRYLDREETPAVRVAIWAALARIGSGAAGASGSWIREVAESLRSKDATVRAAAAFELAEFGAAAMDWVPDLIRGAADPEAAVRGWSIRALGRMGEAGAPAVPALTRAMSNAGETFLNRLEVLSALCSLGPVAHDAVPALVDMLSEPDAMLRARACVALGRVAARIDEAALAALENAAEDSDSDVRRAAQSAIDRLEENP